MSVMQPYFDKRFYAFMDNYCTSVALFEELEERKPLPVVQLGPTGPTCQERFVAWKKRQWKISKEESVFTGKGKFDVRDIAWLEAS